LEPLESRLLLNAGPRVTALVATPNPVARTGAFTLAAAASDVDGSVARVEFFHDANANGRFDKADRSLGVDANPRKGWRLAMSASSLGLGTHTCFARAIDNQGASSRAVALRVIVGSKTGLVGSYAGTIEFNDDQGEDLLRIQITQQGKGFFLGTFHQVALGESASFQGTIGKRNRFTLTYAGSGFSGKAQGTISPDGRTLTGTFRTKQADGREFTGTFSVNRL